MADLSREDVARLRELLERATPDWRRDRFGVIRAGEFKQYVNGACQSQIASFTSDDGGQQRDIDCDLAIAAINALPALLALAVAVAGLPAKWRETPSVGAGEYSDGYNDAMHHLADELGRLLRVEAGQG